ncbi:hypothetical protein G7Y89_g14372 [Cudoniella acicularis]|uniref:RTA1-domain-containing protein n=1 Tax=Cudoniella acicularis TaxID=354080 RepID=A0A8H4R397_9HELO|nr:hypothetical protein G7Y89_g14372 [Cudoniella acicularis]
MAANDSALLAQYGIFVNPNGTYEVPLKNGLGLFTPTDGLTGENKANNTAYGNLLIWANAPQLCNLTVCDLSLAPFDYVPSIGGNSFYTAVFAIFVLINLIQGIRYKTWGYMVAMCLGLAGEVVGYVGRILLWKTPFDPTGNDFLIYLVPLTISPALLTAAIYLCLGRIVVVYGENLSRFRPRTYTFIFCGFDLFSLVLQALGGGIASGAKTYSQQQLGIHIMLAGLSFQVISLAIFAVLCGEFAYRVWSNPNSWSRSHAHLYNSKLFKSFLIGLVVATVTIFVRSVFRVAELSGGFDGPLANDQVSFMILEGAMIVIATSALTFLNPGLCFQGGWEAANFKFGKKVIEAEMEMGGVSDSAESVKPEHGRR